MLIMIQNSDKDLGVKELGYREEREWGIVIGEWGRRSQDSYSFLVRIQLNPRRMARVENTRAGMGFRPFAWGCISMK